jgi:hypothetical protein
VFEKQDIGFEIRPDEDGINYIDEGFNPGIQGENRAVKWPIQGRLEKAHDTIDGIIRKTDIKGMLKGLLQEKTNIKDAYTFGKQGRGYFKNNLLDAIINSQTRSGNDFEDLFNVVLGGRFGPRNNWKAEVSGGKGRAGFNIAKLF